jgi:predicted ATPase
MPSWPAGAGAIAGRWPERTAHDRRRSRIEAPLGEPPPVPELPPQQAQGRFQLVFRRFIAVRRPEHPLALFLDDLQWLDSATLDSSRTC